MAIKDDKGNLHDENNGQFTGKENSAYKLEKLQEAEKIYSSESNGETAEYKTVREDIPSNKGKSRSKGEFFGEEFTGVKGAEAIEKLLKEKRGHVKNAFVRPEIGSIDLVWGDENGGLLHTIQKRDKLLAKGTGHISGLDMARKIPEIIEKGKFDIDERDRPGFIYNNYRVAIRPTYYKEKLNWIVTALEIFPEKK